LQSNQNTASNISQIIINFFNRCHN